MSHTGLNNSAFRSTHFGGTGRGNTGFRSSSFSHVGFGGRGFDRGFGRGFDRDRGFRGRGFGCWGCGFGWGFGWGLGWGWGWGGWWNPWWDPWWWGSSWTWWAPPPAYYYPPNVYQSAPPPYGNGPDVDYDQPSDDGRYSSSNQNYGSTPTSDQPFGGSPNMNPFTLNVAASTPTVLVYLKDGSMSAASDYWLADGKLHYRVNYGGENSVDLDQVDLQRTVDENAKRGVRFSLKSTPDTAPAGPDTSSTDQDKGSAPAVAPALLPEPAEELAAATQPAS